MHLPTKCIVHTKIAVCIAWPCQPWSCLRDLGGWMVSSGGLIGLNGTWALAPWAAFAALFHAQVSAALAAERFFWEYVWTIHCLRVAVVGDDGN